MKAVVKNPEVPNESSIESKVKNIIHSNPGGLNLHCLFSIHSAHDRIASAFKQGLPARQRHSSGPARQLPGMKRFLRNVMPVRPLAGYTSLFFILF